MMTPDANRTFIGLSFLTVAVFVMMAAAGV